MKIGYEGTCKIIYEMYKFDKTLTIIASEIYIFTKTLLK